MKVRKINLLRVYCYGERSSVGRAPVCGTGCRGFESHRSPHIILRLNSSMEFNFYYKWIKAITFQTFKVH
jgi:hypothetical protein